MSIPSILNKIVNKKKKKISLIKQEYKKDIIDKAFNAPLRPPFVETMKKEGLSIIGEIKRGSPSKGIIKENFSPLEIADNYEKVVDAISIITEEDFFFGKPEYLENISNQIKTPILRKDFIIDKHQIYESKVLGASCILLIVAILNENILKHFIKLSESLGLDCIVEIHSKKEVETALRANAKIIGINNRNLHDFSVDINNTVVLSKYIPKNKVIISESGFHTEKDIKSIVDVGVDGILVGESFMKADSIIKKAEEFRNAAVY